MKRMPCRWLPVILFVLTGLPHAWAQSVASRPVTLVVQDPSGAVIPGAQVIVLSPTGELLGRLKTTSQGGAVTLDYGYDAYALCISSPGFRSKEESFDTKKRLAQELMIVLQLGGCTACVTVSSYQEPWPPELGSPPLEDLWAATAAGRVFLPSACMGRPQTYTGSAESRPRSQPAL